MQIVKKMVIWLGVVILILLGIGFLLPSRWVVKREIVIQASPATIYPFIANFEDGWSQWSAFDDEDPDIRYTYSGPDIGVGAKRAWTSSIMGDGWQVITSADVDAGVEFDLVMIKYDSYVKGRITTEKTDEGATRVTWVDSGNVGQNLFKRYLGLFMDRMLGNAFETSLTNLKAKAEATAGAPQQPQQ